MMERARELPVAVVGAGPVGLAAAAHLVERGVPFVVLEAGSAVGAAVREWGHVRLFSPWSYVVDAAARRLLTPTGWVAPEADAYPTGSQVVVDYLEPLASHPSVAPHVRLRRRVVAVARRGADRLASARRPELPFELVVEGPDGQERLLARAVIDASGTWQRPNTAGSGGVPAVGEAGLPQVSHRIPDVAGRDRSRHAGVTTLVIGAGHSAFTGILDLAALAEQVPGTRVVWAVRRGSLEGLFGGGEADALTRRGALTDRVRSLVETGGVEVELDFRTTAMTSDEGRVVVAGVSADGRSRALRPVDRVVVATGFRPDTSLTSELRLALDPVVETTPALAPLIDPNLHTCGTVRPHGASELAHPAEPGFYTVGMKSYGRAPTFLMLTGYEQVRSVVAALAGDLAGARRVELELPTAGPRAEGVGGDAAVGRRAA